MRPALLVMVVLGFTGAARLVPCELGPDAHEIHKRLLHVAGNLTLTGYNPELSNSPWSSKRDLLAKSNIEMNKAIAPKPHWGEQQILARGQALAARALELWPGPDALSELDEPDEATEPLSGTLSRFYLECMDRVSPHRSSDLVRVTDTLRKCRRLGHHGTRVRGGAQ